jgi:hypothetical protein
MNFLRRAAASLALVAAGHAEDLPHNVVQVFGGANNLAFITSPDQVDACVLKAIYRAPPKEDDGRGNDIRPVCYEAGPFTAISQGQLATLRSALLDETTYRWDSVSGCYPVFHTRVRFHKNQHVLVVDFCFGCHLLAVSKDGADCGGGVWSADRKEFIRIMQALFPADAALQKRK